MEKGLWISDSVFMPLSQIGSDLTSEMATRQFALGGYANFFSGLPDPDPILRKHGIDQTVYDNLLNDDQIGSLWERRKNKVKNLDWEVEQNDASDRNVELCRRTLTILENNGCQMKDIIDQTLSPLAFGHSPIEIKWTVGLEWLPVKIWEKPREWFFFDTDNELRFRNNIDFNGIALTGVKAKPEDMIRFILLRNSPTYKNPYGVKFLSRCYYPANLKVGGWRLFSDFLERFGMPFIYGKLPRGAKKEDHDALFNQLVMFFQGAVGTGPDDSSVQLIEMKNTGGDLHDKFIQRCDNAIAKNILYNALSTDIQQVGAKASSETGAKTIEGDITGTDQDFPTTFFNILFKRIGDANFGDGKYCTFKVKKLLEINLDKSTRDKNLKDVGVKFTKEYFKKSYNLEEDDFELNVTPSGVEVQHPSVIPDLIRNPQPGASQGSEIGEEQKTELSGFQKFWNFITRKRLEFNQAEATSSLGEGVGGWADALPDKLLQFGIEETLKPVIELAKNSNSREEFINGLMMQYPNMKTDEVESIATKILFIAEIEGRIGVTKNV